SVKFKMLLVLFLVIVLTSSVVDARLFEDKNSAVMLQGFHWESHKSNSWWKILQAKASEIGKSGFSFIWFPPSSQAASDEGYLPNRLFNQVSLYGNTDELKAAIAAFHKAGVKVLADIVINHRVGTKEWADFKDPEWGPDSVCGDDEWPWAKGNKDTGIRYSAARDIDHTKEYVQKSIIKWMKWLKSDIGYDGWRYDFIKGYDGKYVEMYNKATSPYCAVGEFWDNLDLNNPDPHRQRICDWIDSTNASCGTFDFTTKGVLQKAVRDREYWRLKDSKGKPVGLIGWWSEAAFTFLDNHDTGPSPGGGQNHWPFPSDRIMEGYAYILTHPGIPCVYWTHYFDWNHGKEIKPLILLRKKLKINSKSKVKIMVADSGKYGAIIDDKLAVRIGYGDWGPGYEWDIALVGHNYAVWVKSPRKSTGK
ncbi:alpha-amylase, partial [bacterium]|nr:alpha-amylase [bacterium]